MKFFSFLFWVLLLFSSCGKERDTNSQLFTLKVGEVKQFENFQLSLDSLVSDTRCNVCAFNGNLLIKVSFQEDESLASYFLEKNIYSLSDAFKTDKYKVVMVDCEPRVFGSEEDIVNPDIPEEDYLFYFLVKSI